MKTVTGSGFVPGMRQTFFFILPPLSKIHDVMIWIHEHRAMFGLAFSKILVAATRQQSRSFSSVIASASLPLSSSFLGQGLLMGKSFI